MDRIVCICGSALLFGAAHFQSALLGLIGFIMLFLSIFMDWEE